MDDSRGVARRVAMLALAAILAASVLVSCLTIAETADHECEGDDCPICLVIDAAKAMLSTSGSLGTGAIAAVAALAGALAVLAPRRCPRTTETPITQRVKLVI